MNTLKHLKSKKNKYLKLLKILENNIKDCKKQILDIEKNIEDLIYKKNEESKVDLSSLKVNDKIVLRNGKVQKVLEIRNATYRPYYISLEVTNGTGYGSMYMHNGRYSDSASTIHEFDIVEIIKPKLVYAKKNK